MRCLSSRCMRETIEVSFMHGFSTYYCEYSIFLDKLTNYRSNRARRLFMATLKLGKYHNRISTLRLSQIF